MSVTPKREDKEARPSAQAASSAGEQSAVLRRDSVNRLRWLLEFSRHSKAYIEQLQERDLETLDSEASLFAKGKPTAQGPALSRPGWTDGIRADLWKLASFAHDTILNFMDGGVLIEPAVLGQFARWVSRSGVQYYDGDRSAIFANECGRLLADEGHRIEICKSVRCNRPFVKRKRGEYCSSQCSRRERTGRYRRRLKPDDRYIERHSQYVKSRNRLGLDVKPRGRRPLNPWRFLGGKSLVSTCPGDGKKPCGHKNSVVRMRETVHCGGCGGYYVAGSLNTVEAGYLCDSYISVKS